MTAQQTNPYLRTRILTAGPQQLRLMLYDGAIRFIRQGQQGLHQRDFESAYNGFSRAKRIVLELSTSLNPQIAPELCEKLNALYNYIYKLLVDTSLHRDPAIADEAVSLLEYERETWQMMMQHGGELRPPRDVPPAAQGHSSVPQAPGHAPGPYPGPPPADPGTLSASA